MRGCISKSFFYLCFKLQDLQKTLGEVFEYHKERTSLIFFSQPIQVPRFSKNIRKIWIFTKIVHIELISRTIRATYR